MSDDDPMEETHRSMQQLGMAVAQGAQGAAQHREQKLRQQPQQRGMDAVAYRAEREAARHYDREGQQQSIRDDPTTPNVDEQREGRRHAARSEWHGNADLAAADRAYEHVHPRPTASSASVQRQGVAQQPTPRQERRR